MVGPRATHQGGAQGGGKGSPPRAPKVGPTRAHLGAPTKAIKGGEGAPHTEALAAPSQLAPPFSPSYSSSCASSSSCSCGSSNPKCGTSSRTCGLRGGAALAAQGRAVHEEVHTTALPASICTTPAHYKSSATARLVVIP